MKIILRITLVCAILSSCGKKQDHFSSIEEPNINKRLKHLIDSSAKLIDSRKLRDAQMVLDSAYKIAVDISDSSLLSRVSNNYGSLYYQLGLPEKSIEYYNNSIEIDRALGDSSAIGFKLKNLGISYRQKGESQKALNYLLQGLTIVKRSRNRNEEASINNTIGNIYNNLDDYKKGYFYLDKSQKIWLEQRDSSRYSKALSNLGNSLLGLGDTAEAVDVYNKSLSIKKRLNLKYSAAITLNNLGEAMIKLANFQKARDYFLESIKLRRESGQLAGIALVSNNLAHLELVNNNLSEVQKWLNIASDITTQTGAIDIQTETLRIQKELYFQTREYKKAYETANKYDSLKQVTFNEQVINVKDIQYAYDLDLEETQKELFKARFEASEAERQAQELKNEVQTYVLLIIILIAIITGYFAYKLRKQNRHIENLIRELHHRVKNHLGMISGMFDAQSLEAGGNADLLEEARTRVEAVNGIHRRLYRQDEYEYVNMKEYLTELVDNSALVFGVFGNLEKQLEIQNEPLAIDKAISVGLIANEILTNSFKYGLQKTEKPILKVVLEKAVKGYRMLIYNNAPHNSETLTESTGFGSELIRRLTANLKGEAHTTEENGFHFELTFP